MRSRTAANTSSFLTANESMLEYQPPGVMYQLGASLDELRLKAAQCPLLHRFWQDQPPQEVAEIVGQHKQLQPSLGLATNLWQESRVQLRVYLASLRYTALLCRLHCRSSLPLPVLSTGWSR
jgi:hypothetical protein